MVTEESVKTALKEVIDPEIGLDIVNLGLVYGITITGSDVLVTMTLTTTGCPLHDSFETGVINAVKKVEGIGEVKVSIVWDPPWMIDMVTPDGKAQLGR